MRAHTRAQTPTLTQSLTRGRSRRSLHTPACAHRHVSAPANRVRCVRYCYFSALKILVVFLQTHGFVLAFRENYNLPIYRWAPARQRQPKSTKGTPWSTKSTPVGSRPPALAAGKP